MQTVIHTCESPTVIHSMNCASALTVPLLKLPFSPPWASLDATGINEISHADGAWAAAATGERQKKKKESVSWLRNPHGRHFRNGRKGWNSPAAHWFNKYLPKLCQDGEITLSAAASLLSRRVGEKNPHKNKSFPASFQMSAVCVSVCVPWD